MIKIAHVRDLSKLKDYPTEVIELIHHHVTVLDTEYGENRDIDEDDGGYILIIEKQEEIEQLKEVDIDLEDITPEYVEKIEIPDEYCYTNTLIIMNNEFAVNLIIPFRMTPVILLDELGN